MCRKVHALVVLNGNKLKSGSQRRNPMTGASLTTEIEDRNGVKLIHLAGPLDSMTHDQFKALVDPLASQDHVRIVLDCRNLSYVNSRGITLLARYQRGISANLGFFGIAALNPRILKAIELLGMSKLVRLYSDVDEALQAASSL
jgi:anti-anti-sigma factor